MTLSPIERLPEEIQVQIFRHLDSKPPSEVKGRREPSLLLTSTDEAVYKKISLVSRQWRRIVLPLLFRATRLQLNNRFRPEWDACSICGRSQSGKQQLKATDLAINSPTDYHAAIFAEATEAGHFPDPNDGFVNGSLGSESLRWVRSFHHELVDFLDFVRAHGLAASVESVTILTKKMLVGRRADRYPHHLIRNGDYRYKAATAMWQLLLSEIDVTRIVILAPPVDLACLTNCRIDLDGDWAFADMDYHILEVSMDAAVAKDTPFQFLDYQLLQYAPDTHPIAGSSVLKLRPWTHLALNEGSFLRAYGTYEYFERGPPSLIYSIKNSLASPRVEPLVFATLGSSSDGNGSNAAPPQLPALHSLTYTAILPFATHLDFRGFLPYISELDVQLAPGPDDHDILHDRARVGHAQLEDCWLEFVTAYRVLTRPFRTFEIRPDGSPRLRRFVCRDVRLPALREELDDEFVPLCLPIWAEMQPGVFTRMADRLTRSHGGGDPFDGFD